MISLRQHAFSLAAVFVALAMGVVLGSGFLSDTLLSSLRDEKRDLYTQISGLNDQKNALNEKLSAANNFDAQLVGRMVHETLAGKTVVVFRTPDAKDDDVAAVSKIIIERPHKKCRVTIYAARPGVMIGKKGGNQLYTVAETGKPGLDHCWYGFSVKRERGEYVLTASGKRAQYRSSWRRSTPSPRPVPA